MKVSSHHSPNFYKIIHFLVVTTQVLDLRGLEQPFHPLPLPKTVGVSRLKWLNRDLGDLNWRQAEQLRSANIAPTAAVGPNSKDSTNSLLPIR